MSSAAVEAWTGNQSIASTIALPIAIATSLSSTTHTIGRRLRIASSTEAFHGARVYVTAGMNGGYHRGDRHECEKELCVEVRNGMSSVVLTVGPLHTLREAARAMAERQVGAAVVIDPDQPGPGIFTERDLLDSLGRGEDPETERVADHLSADLTFAAPDWSLERAAEEMVRGGFRHLVVIDGGELAGIVSMRDIVRCWVTDGATSEMPTP